MIKNTCAFDAILQSLLVGYRDWTSYYDYINTHSNNVLKFVQMVSTVSTSQKVHKERVLILSSIFPPINSTIECAYNISQLVAKLLMQDALSYEMVKQCLTCEWVHQEKITIIEINTKPMYKNGTRGLEKARDEKIEVVNKMRTMCK